jgi:HEAT repeat protein
MDNVDSKLLNMLINSLGDNEEVEKGLTIKDNAYRAIVAMGEDVVAPLTEYLEKSNFQNRDINQEVAHILLDISKVYKNNTPLSVFMKAANGISEFRWEAITALGYIGDKASYKLVVKILKDPKEEISIKMNAVHSFGLLHPKYGKKEDLELLIDLMESLSNSRENNVEIHQLKFSIIGAIYRIYNKSEITIGEYITERTQED